MLVRIIGHNQMNNRKKQEIQYFQQPQGIYAFYIGQNGNIDLDFLGQRLANHRKIHDELLSMFGETKDSFSLEPTACQVLLSIIIIAKLSFWINKPYLPSLIEALDQYKEKDYFQKLKTYITSDLVNSGGQDIVMSLYRQMTEIDG